MKSQTLFSSASAGSGIVLLSASNHLTGSVVSSGPAAPRWTATAQDRQHEASPGTHQNSFSSEKPVNAFSCLLRAMRTPNRKERSVRTLMPAP